jgi:hypothetical protein
LKKVSPRGRVPVSLDPVYRATWAYLEELTSSDGIPFEGWLLDLTLEELEALKRAAKKVKSLPKRNWKLTLSLDDWKQTAMGLAVFRREGQEGFEAWALRQTEKLIEWNQLRRTDLLDPVEARTGEIWLKPSSEGHLEATLTGRYDGLVKLLNRGKLGLNLVGCGEAIRSRFNPQ